MNHRTDAAAGSIAPATPHTLHIELTLPVPREAVWRCWTEPALLMQWYCPRPWRVVQADMELHVGGRHAVRMQGPAGESVDVPGVVLAIEPGRRLVFSNAFERAWVPATSDFMMVAEVTLDDAPEQRGHTRYRAQAMHWSQEACDRHAAMGFHEGWRIAAEQLVEVARGL